MQHQFHNIKKSKMDWACSTYGEMRYEYETLEG